MVKDLTFLKGNNMRIQGRICLPEKVEGRLPLVIFCHGFGSNYRELIHHGEGFAQAGFCCLFFDFCGGGLDVLSDGTMQDMTIRSECEDLKTVLACVKELDYVDPDRICLLGESMGGLISALVAAECPEQVRALVLWYPAFVIPDDARRRHEAGEQDVVFGIRLGGAFDREVLELDVYGRIASYEGPVLMIHGEKDLIVPLAYSRRALPAYKDARLIVIPGAGHGYEGADSVAAREYSVSFIQKHCG